MFSILFFLYLNFFSKNKKIEISSDKLENTSASSNIIEKVNYSSTDAQGNEYIIDASKGEIDYSNTNVIYLTNVKALVKMNNANDVKIKSDFGKYNIDNYDTIFSQNVIIDYLDNQITGEYLDFSIKRNSMIISTNVVYTNLQNILKADVVEINIQTKDTNIFMYENNKKVNIKSKN